MNIKDYLIDCTNCDWQKMLAPWSWCLPGTFTTWMMNRFGDLFLITDDGKIHVLRLDNGRLHLLADSKDDFSEKMGDAETANDWLLIPLVDRLVSSGVSPGAGQCYAFVQIPILGGDYVVENVVVREVESQYLALGPIFAKLDKLPDGTKVDFRITK